MILWKLIDVISITTEDRDRSDDCLDDELPAKIQEAKGEKAEYWSRGIMVTDWQAKYIIKHCRNAGKPTWSDVVGRCGMC